MRIAFDAKRAYHNNTGLGNYSRSLITSLAAYYPDNSYYLMAAKQTNLFDAKPYNNVHTIMPTGVYKWLPSLWRSKYVTQTLRALDIDIYHGLSNEIPVGIHRTAVKSVVSIHDLIFERYPNQYKATDNAIYRRKFSYACLHADKVMAMSEQTKQDIINYYKTPAEKIEVCYQSCNPVFEQRLTPDVLQRVRQAYKLPQNYLLYIGSVIERKNLLNICRALQSMQPAERIPLVVIGQGKAYMQQVKTYIAANNLEKDIVFLSEQASAAAMPGFATGTDFPAIYQLATALIYPSLYEGFGIPILEAMWSGTPVITSSVSCMPETGGDAACYINPLDVEDIAHAIHVVANDSNQRADMVAKGFVQAKKFSPAVCAAAVMRIYQSL
ncbi:group 1 glycosyl transferase [Chitinophagaceae bacterium IBVUCB1]|nr:group 1 glycosyl transferase [Chitinophagaceae bacterium IBVUCB1]